MLFPGIDLSKVDDTNYLMDFPSQVVGPSHRKYFHDTDLLNPENILIHQFDPEKMASQLMHIYLDHDKDMQKYLLIWEILNGNR